MILNECGDMTAQEVATELHRRGLVISDERNFAAPRLTELYKPGRCGLLAKSIVRKQAGKSRYGLSGKNNNF